jgi:hypothetical protein
MRLRNTDSQKSLVWSQTDLQAECSRSSWLTEERYASAQGYREKTSKPVLEILIVAGIGGKINYMSVVP